MHVEEFYNEALICLEKYPCDEKKAVECLEKVLSEKENHRGALSHLGELLCNASDGEVRDPKRGIEYLKLFLTVEPNQVPECYFHLAQALAMEPKNGLDAVHYYRLGINKLAEQLPLQTGSIRFTFLKYLKIFNLFLEQRVKEYSKEKIGMAYCSIAELYTTDLRYDMIFFFCKIFSFNLNGTTWVFFSCEENAETYILESYKKAIEISPTLLDAFSGLVKYYSIKGLQAEAFQVAENGMRVFRKSAEIMKTCEYNGMMDNYVSVPDFNSQLDFATSLINLNQLDWSEFVLDTILEQDEHNVEVWLVYAAYYIVKKDADSARECVQKGSQILQKAIEQCVYSNNIGGQHYIQLCEDKLKRMKEEICQISV
ncbi:uncharacterized protein LOC128883146 isoform X2 [Hylaeus volcanicus]|uniref:uncharacterized protein LOC128883146 isoform X2 n=1 Tax=Hylaeus volcanicus TaxID=313075 RepID=UPI0023B7F7D4|nr:uncharacterized protein LOC128883146 isoform X2 [Hylaeus volcanicus]